MQERLAAETVECRALAVRDAGGRLRASILTTEDGAVGVSLNSPTEKPRLLLTVEDGVVRFLNALGQSRSLEEALEAALPFSFGEFNRQWMQWIGGD